MPDANTADSSPERPETASPETPGRNPAHQETAPTESGAVAEPGSATEAGSATPESASRAEQARQVFRVSPVSVLFVVFLLVCMTPVAAGPYRALLALYVIPLALLAWILRNRTVADRTGLTARTMFGSRHIGWAELRGLRLVGRTRTMAVLADDSEVRLPEVRLAHLPLLSELSGGRIPDPTAPAADPAPEPAATESAAPESGAAEPGPSKQSESEQPESEQSESASATSEQASDSAPSDSAK